MSYSHILFDLDGTLVDSRIGIHHSFNEALRLFGHDISLDALEKKIGPPALEAFRELFPDLFNDPKNLKKALRNQRRYYRTQGVLECTVYPHVVTLLKSLKKQGKTLCIATSKPTVFAKKMLAYQKLSTYFDVIVGSTLNLSRTKKTDVIAAVLKKYPKVASQKIIMIGDKRHDIEAAKTNHLDSIGVTYGFGSHAEIEKSKPTFIANTVLELVTLLE